MIELPIVNLRNGRMTLRQKYACRRLRVCVPPSHKKTSHLAFDRIHQNTPKALHDTVFSQSNQVNNSCPERQNAPRTSSCTDHGLWEVNGALEAMPSSFPAFIGIELETDQFT